MFLCYFLIIITIITLLYILINEYKVKRNKRNNTEIFYVEGFGDRCRHDGRNHGKRDNRRHRKIDGGDGWVSSDGGNVWDSWVGDDDYGYYNDW